MKALGQAVGKNGGVVNGWAELVLRREEAERDREMRRKVSGGSGGSGKRAERERHHQKTKSVGV